MMGTFAGEDIGDLDLQHGEVLGLGAATTVPHCLCLCSASEREVARVKGFFLVFFLWVQDPLGWSLGWNPPLRKPVVFNVLGKEGEMWRSANRNRAENQQIRFLFDLKCHTPAKIHLHHLFHFGTVLKHVFITYFIFITLISRFYWGCCWARWSLSKWWTTTS